MLPVHNTRKIDLFFETELFDKRVVAALIACLEIAQMRTAVRHHLEKAPARMKIFRVLLQVSGELVDLLGKERDLYIRRAGVCVVPSGAFHHRRLFLSGKHEYLYPTTSYLDTQVSSDNVRNEMLHFLHGGGDRKAAIS